MRPNTFTLLLVLTLAAGPLAAEVIENVDYEYYDVEHERGEPLRSTITAASPIEDGFHGYTKWYVRWRFNWQYDSDGTCWITTVKVNLDATITLPELYTDDHRAQARFDEYIEALQGHEEGHLANGRQAADEVESELGDMEAYDSCGELEAAANTLAKQVVARGNRRDKAYDKRTGHGRTEGAYLD
ncbi:MAG: DUF922 domain-containing protein [Ahniella sp.]|nr:DUF922 domain-containing protein [Ahniella sp.]